MSDRPSRRRSPLQERSQGTVQRVLSAASSLLAGGAPVEALTTAQIAAAAGLSVGALYRFFPDKQAIVDAIAVRHMEVFQERLLGVIMANIPGDAPGFLTAVIDGFVAYLDANQDFRIIAFGATEGGRSISRPLRDAYASAQVTAPIQEFLIEMFDIAAPENFGFRLRIATEIGDRLLGYALEQTDSRERTRILDETKRLLSGYLFGDA